MLGPGRARDTEEFRETGIRTWCLAKGACGMLTVKTALTPTQPWILRSVILQHLSSRAECISLPLDPGLVLSLALTTDWDGRDRTSMLPLGRTGSSAPLLRTVPAELGRRTGGHVQPPQPPQPRPQARETALHGEHGSLADSHGAVDAQVSSPSPAQSETAWGPTD